MNLIDHPHSLKKYQTKPPPILIILQKVHQNIILYNIGKNQLFFVFNKMIEEGISENKMRKGTSVITKLLHSSLLQ